MKRATPRYNTDPRVWYNRDTDTRNAACNWPLQRRLKEARPREARLLQANARGKPTRSVVEPQLPLRLNSCLNSWRPGSICVGLTEAESIASGAARHFVCTMASRDFSFFIDRGGTFTDVVARISTNGGGTRLRVTKV